MKKMYSVLGILFFAANAFAQNVGINTTNPQVALDIQGALATRITYINPIGNFVTIPPNVSVVSVSSGSAVTDTITCTFAPPFVQGQRLIVHNENGYSVPLRFAGAIIPINEKREFICGLPGGWSLLSGSLTNEGWRTKGNAGTDTSVNFVGTTDNMPLLFKVNNTQAGLINPNTLGDVSFGFESLAKHKNAFGGNVSLGTRAMYNDTSGLYNVAIGNSALFHNTNKEDNVAIGSGAMYNNGLGLSNSDPTKGSANTAIGAAALQNNRRGSGAVAIGSYSAFSDTAANGIIAIGRAALYYNKYIGLNEASGSIYSGLVGINNLAIGDSALFNNSTGAVSTSATASNNIAIGKRSLFFNTTGSFNNASGLVSMYRNTTGSFNVASGSLAAYDNQTGTNNTSIGFFAAVRSEGSHNTAIGSNALGSYRIGDRNTAIGTGALTGATNSNSFSGSGNVAIGYQAGGDQAVSDKLFIENSRANKDSALIYGDFAADSLLLNAKTLVRDKLGIKGAGGNTGIELGYGIAGKETNAGRIGFGLFTPNAIDFVGGGTTSTPRLIKFWAEGGSTFTGKIIPDADNAYSLGQSGNRWSTVWAASGVVSTSDANLKTNITTSPYGLQQVLQMKPVQYNWKTNPTADLQIGFLAQDIKKIIPEAVITPTNGDPMGMKYSELIPVLVKAIQEQQKRADEQEKRIIELETIIKKGKLK
jgi:trimeric autotransporter adhesin